MIIGIDATRANKPHKTGVEWYSYHLIRELAKQPAMHTIRLYFRDEPEQGLRDLGPHVQYRILTWPFPYLWTQLRLSFEMLINPPDLLFIPAQIIPLIHPTRTITTIHDVAFKPYPKSYSRKSRWYQDFAVKYAKKLPLILTVSEFSKKEIHKYYNIPVERIAVTPLGFSHETGTATETALTKYEISKPYFLYVGRLERKKNITTIVKSFDLIKKEPWAQAHHLVLVGVKGHGWEEIERTIAKSNYKDQITIIGWITEDEKHTIMANADCFILLSAYEGFGLPLLEAMAAGTPVVCSNQASLPEVAGDAALLVPRNDPQAVVEACTQLHFDESLKNHIIERGKKRCTEFSWHITAQKTQEAFSRVLSDHSL